MHDHKRAENSEELRVRGTGIWEHYGISDGLPDLKIESIAQDSRGTIWVGTHDCGVARKDGARFTCFSRHDGLVGNGVYSITEDHDGKLWFGTNRGLTVYDGTTFEAVETDESFGLLWGSHCGRNGDLWFGVGRRPGEPAAVCRVSGGKTELLTVHEEATEFGESIHAIWEDEQGALWIGGDALYCCELGGKGLVQRQGIVSGPEGVRAIQGNGERILVADRSGIWCVEEPGCRKIAEVPQGAHSLDFDFANSTWVASSATEVFRIGEAGSELVGKFSHHVFTTLADGFGGVWVGTYGNGLHRRDEYRWRAFEGLSANGGEPTCVVLDANRRATIGTAEGIWVEGVEGDIVWQDVGKDLDIGTNNITALFSNGDSLWIGFREGAIARVSTGNTKVVRPAETRGFRIVSICSDEEDGSIWYAASLGRGVGRIRNGKAEHFGPSSSLTCPHWVSQILYARSQRSICIGTCEGTGDDGVFRVDDDGVVPILKLDGSVNAIAERDGDILIGTSEGVGIYRAGSSVDSGPDQFLPCGIVTCLHIDGHKNAWIGTEGRGIGRFDGDTLVFLTIPGGLDRNCIKDLTTDSDGHAWIVVGDGLVRYRSMAATIEANVRVHTGGQEISDQGTNVVSGASALELEFLYDPSHGHKAGIVRQYRVLERGEQWIEVGASRASLGVLEPGQFNIECRVVDCDLNYSATRAFSIEVEHDRRDLLVREALTEGSERVLLLGTSPSLLETKAAIARVAPSDMTVLILGETGTGKSIAAKNLHALSARRDGPFVQVNCGAIAESLSEAELFGHERGAFTGAVSRRVGKFQLADGGTVFLDEVGDLPLPIQAKLLHVLQDRVVEPVGSARSIPIDVRIVAATNRDLEEAVAEGRFRQDLLYRLNAFTVTLPTLRSRPSDLPLLARHFSQTFARHLNRACPEILPEAMTILAEYAWPGNVRELEHMMERAVLLSAERGQISPADLSIAVPVQATSQANIEARLETLTEHERTHILRVLDRTAGVVQGQHGAADILGINPSTLRSRMKKLGIQRPQ